MVVLIIRVQRRSTTRYSASSSVSTVVGLYTTPIDSIGHLFPKWLSNEPRSAAFARMTYKLAALINPQTLGGIVVDDEAASRTGFGTNESGGRSLHRNRVSSDLITNLKITNLKAGLSNRERSIIVVLVQRRQVRITPSAPRAPTAIPTMSTN